MKAITSSYRPVRTCLFISFVPLLLRPIRGTLHHRIVGFSAPFGVSTNAPGPFTRSSKLCAFCWGQLYCSYNSIAIGSQTGRVVKRFLLFFFFSRWPQCWTIITALNVIENCYCSLEFEGENYQTIWGGPSWAIHPFLLIPGRNFPRKPENVLNNPSWPCCLNKTAHHLEHSPPLQI